MRSHFILVLAFAIPHTFAAVTGTLVKKGPDPVVASHDVNDVDSHGKDINQLEARGITRSCITCMAICLAGAGLSNFAYGLTKVTSYYRATWVVCSLGCVAEDACFNSRRPGQSETGLMYTELKGKGLTEDGTCLDYNCTDTRGGGSDDACFSLGCGPCGFMGPPDRPRLCMAEQPPAPAPSA